MNKKRIRMLGISTLIFSLCFPLIVGIVQDYHDINKELSLEDNQTQEILENHPIIGNIYQVYQSGNLTDSRIEYKVRQKDEYTPSEQETLLHLQSLFTKEIQQLLQNHVLNTSLLETDSTQDYQADFGTLVTFETEEYYRLEQVLRMWEKSFKSIDYIMEPKTNKIIGINITQQEILSLSDDQLKKITWAMIQYLELDDIDDWSYNQYGYESNKAKLRISCTLQKRTEMYTFDIDVSLLGILNKNIYQSIASY